MNPPNDPPDPPIPTSATNSPVCPPITAPWTVARPLPPQLIPSASQIPTAQSSIPFPPPPTAPPSISNDFSPLPHNEGVYGSVPAAFPSNMPWRGNEQGSGHERERVIVQSLGQARHATLPHIPSMYDRTGHPQHPPHRQQYEPYAHHGQSHAYPRYAYYTPHSHGGTHRHDRQYLHPHPQPQSHPQIAGGGGGGDGNPFFRDFRALSELLGISSPSTSTAHQNRYSMQEDEERRREEENASATAHERSWWKNVIGGGSGWGEEDSEKERGKERESTVFADSTEGLGKGEVQTQQQMRTVCQVCATSLRHDPARMRFKCTICHTVTDLESGPDDATVPPMTTAEIVAFESSFDTPEEMQSSLRTIEFMPDSYDTSSASDQLSNLSLAGSSASSERIYAFARRVYSVFKSIRTLHFSFMKEMNSGDSAQEKQINGRSDGDTLDLGAVKRFYEIVLLCPLFKRELADALDLAMKKPGFAVREFDKEGRTMWWALILWECPLLQRNIIPDPPKRQRILSRFLGLISGLSNELHHHQVSHFSNPGYPTSSFITKIDLVNSFISECLYAIPERLKSQYRDSKGAWFVKAAARVMALFWASNTKFHRADISAFYNMAIDLLGRPVMLEDFHLWLMHRPRQFTFCQYPFLLSMGLKQSLLNEESRALLQRNAQHALHSTVYHGRLVMPVFLLRVRRDHVMHDSISQIASATPYDFRKQLKVQFAGEEGIDAGGLKKEWFLIISRELFDPQFGMFSYDEDSHLCWFNCASMESPDEYYLVGVLIGLAVVNVGVLDIPLPLACFKKLLGLPIDLDDLAQLHPGLTKGLRQLLAYEDDDLEEVFCRTFVGEYEAWGQVVSTPLIPNGENVPVTKNNRKQYVERLTDYILTESIATQFDHFKRGFDSVSRPSAALSLLRGEELELLIRGSIEELNIHDLRASTHHEGFTSAEERVVDDFWDFFAKLNPERQRKLLMFITGSDRIPATGISGLQMKLVHAGPDPGSRFPQARTCFNVIMLPSYPTREIFEEKMNRAIDESQGFGLK